MRNALWLMLASTVALADYTTYSVMLTDAGQQKIQVIKIIREYTSLGLKDAKDLVEAPKPVLIRDGLSLTEADALVAALKEKGATAEVQQGGARVAPQPPKPAPRGDPVDGPHAEGTFDVKLENYGEAKILVIKIVRDATGLGLADTKKLVESAPVVVKKGLNRATAETMVKDIAAAGGKASLSPSR